MLGYLRGGSMAELPRSQVDNIQIGGEPIQTPVRGLLNGAIVLASSVAAYVWVPDHTKL